MKRFLKKSGLRVLMITSEWPTEEKPFLAPVVVRQVEFLRRCGVEVTVLPFRGGMKLKNYVNAWRLVKQEQRRNTYDLVHAQWGQSGLPALDSSLPLVVTYRGSDLEGIVGDDGRYTVSGRVLSWLSRCVALRASQNIAVSTSLARRIPRRNVHVIPSGVDLSRFHPIARETARRSLGLDLGKTYALFAASRANPVKRFELASSAVDHLRSLRPEMDLELISLGQVTIDQMPAWMNACDALLLTSRHEGSPDVVKEAIACNLPVVSTDVGDVRERLAGLAGCEIVEEDSPEVIAQALGRVLERRGRLDAQEAARRLDETLLTRQVIEVYELALGDQ